MSKNFFVLVSFLSLFGVLVLTASASTTISTNVSTGGTLTVTGVSTLTGAVTATGGIVSGSNITVPAAYGVDAASAGVLNIGTTTATGITIGSSGITTTLPGTVVTGAASSTSIKVGTDQVSTVSGMIFGTCTLVSVDVTATSTAYTTCTGATGVTSSYSVFVQVNNVLPGGLILDAASSTATTGTLSLRFFNAAASSTPSTLTTGTPAVNFWAVR